MDLVTPAPSHASAAPHATLDELLALDANALGALYQQASVPRLEALQGDLRGRMLALGLGLPPMVAELVRQFAASDLFPWRGKSFTTRPDGQRGDGINRVLVDGLRLFRFETFVGPSRAGAFDAVQLDYDNADNPFFIRPVKDELRQLSPGLYLGQAYLQLGDKTHLALYFGLTSLP